jgi:hypothetical protein
MRRAVVSSPLLLCLLLPTPPALAQSFCAPVAPVDMAGATVLGNGSPGSISTAQLQAALDAGGRIRLDQGAAPSTITLTQTLQISREAVLDGGGLVTLSGSGTRRIAELSNPNPAPDAPLFSITLQNVALRDGRSPDGRGGAIYKEHDFEFPHKVSLRLVNCRFDNNLAPLDGTPQDDGGGAFYGELLNRIDVANCVFSGNQGSNGGALYSLGSLAVNIVDSRFEGNAAIGSGGNPGNGGNGGAIGIDGAARTVDICRSQLVDNTSRAFGGGFFSVMYDAQSRTRFEDVLIQGNRQLDAGQHSGGVYLQDGPWAMERVSFINNEAEGFGGLFVAGNAPGTLRNATFSGNVARVGLGGAMALTASAPIDIVNSSIANNVATAAFVGGIQIDSPNQLRLTNTVIANNSGGNRFVPWNIRNPAAFDGGGNLQWPATRPMGGGNEPLATATVILADPLLPTVPTGTNIQTLPPAPGSPLIDAGVSGALVPATDARGVGRSGGVDIGSHEREPEGRIFRSGFESGETAG